MKRKGIAILGLCLMAILSGPDAFSKVKTGIECLVDMGFSPLEGKRVGLLTNQTGVDSHLKRTIDILFEAPNVNLTTLFCPEHGIDGYTAAGEKVYDSYDAKTGLRIYSLYGKDRKPSPEMLQNVDIVIYDIQDVGTRSYTYISTMGLMMQACSDLGKQFMVLDRPNPLGGLKVEGPYVESGYYSFVSRYKIPYVYGMTAGELAYLINEEGLPEGSKGEIKPMKCDLLIVKMLGWKRKMQWKDTGLPWIETSPKIPSSEAAIGYPCAGLCGDVTGFISIGLNSYYPFRCFAAPWIDAGKLCDKLNSYNLKGIVFTTMHFKDAGVEYHGVKFNFTDYFAANLTLIQFYVMQAIGELWPDKKAFAVGKVSAVFDKCAGGSTLRTSFAKRHQVEDIIKYWNKDANDFRTRRTPYLLYQ